MIVNVSLWSRTLVFKLVRIWIQGTVDEGREQKGEAKKIKIKSFNAVVFSLTPIFARNNENNRKGDKHRVVFAILWIN